MSRKTRFATLVAGASMVIAPFVGSLAAHADETNTMPNADLETTVECPATMPRLATSTCSVTVTNVGPEGAKSVTVLVGVAGRDATLTGGCSRLTEVELAISEAEKCTVGTVQPFGGKVTVPVHVWVGGRAEGGDSVAVVAAAYPLGEDRWLDKNTDHDEAVVASQAS